MACRETGAAPCGALNEICYALGRALAAALATLAFCISFLEKPDPVLRYSLLLPRFISSLSVHSVFTFCLVYLSRTYCVLAPALGRGFFLRQACGPICDDAAQPMLDCFGIMIRGIPS